MSKFPLLFQKGCLGPMHLRNRIVMAPLGTNLADSNGGVTRALIDWYAERAREGVGLIIVENSLADVRFGRGLARQLRIDDPKFTPGLNELVEAVQAAGIAKSSGFDAVEIHGAHGYLLAGFLSPFSNKRDDEYGKDLEGRLKFVAEVYEGIREEVGREYPLLFRLSGREYLEGGRQGWRLRGSPQNVATMLCFSRKSDLSAVN